jgi:hypothetical protein
MQWLTKAPFLRIKQRRKIEKQKILNETFHGRRHVGRPRLRRGDTIRKDSLLMLCIRGWRRLVGDGYLEAEILQRSEDVCSYCYTLVFGPQAAWVPL